MEEQDRASESLSKENKTGRSDSSCLVTTEYFYHFLQRHSNKDTQLVKKEICVTTRTFLSGSIVIKLFSACSYS